MNSEQVKAMRSVLMGRRCISVDLDLNGEIGDGTLESLALAVISAQQRTPEQPSACCNELVAEYGRCSRCGKGIDECAGGEVGKCSHRKTFEPAQPQAPEDVVERMITAYLGVRWEAYDQQEAKKLRKGMTAAYQVAAAHLLREPSDEEMGTAKGTEREVWYRAFCGLLASRHTEHPQTISDMDARGGIPRYIVGVNCLIPDAKGEAVLYSDYKVVTAHFEAEKQQALREQEERLLREPTEEEYDEVYDGRLSPLENAKRLIASRRTEQAKTLEERVTIVRVDHNRASVHLDGKPHSSDIPYRDADLYRLGLIAEMREKEAR